MPVVNAKPSDQTLLQRIHGLEHFVDHVLWERGVGERCDLALAGSDDPIEQILEHLLFARIGIFDGNQHPGEAGDGISVGAGRVSDGDTEVSGICFTLAAASVTPSMEAFSQLPAAFLIAPKLMWFSRAYVNST